MGIEVALLFVGLPFIVRTVQPVLAGLDRSADEAALVLGASPSQIVRRVILPVLMPAIATGAALAFARAVGEFGAVSVVSGRIRGVTNTMPLHTEVLYQEYNLPVAFGVATLLAGAGLLTIGVRATLDWRQARARARGGRARLMAAA